MCFNPFRAVSNLVGIISTIVRSPDRLQYLRFCSQYEWIMFKIWLMRESDKEDTEEWIESYIEDEDRGNAILQRIQQLTQGSEVYEYNFHSDQGSFYPETEESQTPIDREHTNYGEYDREREIQGLRWEYLCHQRRLAAEWAGRPRNALMEYDDFLGVYEGNTGYDNNWASDSAGCSRRGGCCARTCGCCEKPIREYFRLSKRTGRKELVKVYGHCTSECGCCVITHGVYIPDPRLPKPKFIVERQEQPYS